MGAGVVLAIAAGAAIIVWGGPLARAVVRPVRLRVGV